MHSKQFPSAPHSLTSSPQKLNSNNLLSTPLSRTRASSASSRFLNTTNLTQSLVTRRCSTSGPSTSSSKIMTPATVPTYSLKKKRHHGGSTNSMNNKSLRTPNSSRKASVSYLSEAKLERVLGCTACPSSFAIDQTTGMIAYAAGSTVVLITKNNGQFHFVNNSKNNITCITFSSNGKYLATGEFGNSPMVRVWEICKDGTFQGQQIAELKYHTLGVLCVKFTHDSTQLISVGIQHDKSVAVWDWRGQKKIAENRLTSQVNAMDISEDGNCFVTVGVRHVKFWMLNGKEKALSGRSAILAEQRNNTFLDICCAPGNRAFALTDTRLLVEFFDKKIVNTFELTGEIPYSITLGPLNHLLIGFSNGHVRAINTETIEVQQLPGIPHYLHHDISTASGHESFYQEGINAVKSNERFPDVKALLYHSKSKTLTVLYSDRSIYQWLLTDSFGQSLLIGYRNHVGAILDLEMVPKNLPWLPAGTFMTSGVDATIRFWSLEKPNENVASILSNNILSPELKKVLFLSPDEKLLSDHADNHSGMIFSDPLDSTTGARCLKLSPDGRHLAAGFRDGNLGVFDITTDKFEQLISVEAHDGEMLCIEYADPQKTDGHTMLASGGRDRLIHLYDAENGYQHLATVEDHSSSVNSIKFLPISNGYEMFTCATDKLVVIRRVTYDPSSSTGITLERINQFSSPSGLNYLTTSPDGNLIGACQDRQLRTYTMNGKMNKQIKGTLCEEGTLTKLALDPSGTYAATVCSDRYVYVIDISTGECAAVLNGQADCVTSIAFTPDCRRLVVVSHSGCVFVWRLSNMLTKRMTTKLGKTETSSSLTTGVASAAAPLNDRCSTPDSLIESGSDSASFIGSSSKKDHPHRAQLNASGSEFGSLTSIQITQDDDLDSGVGGGHPRQHPPPVVINDSEISLNDPSNFEIRRLPARSTKDLTLEGFEDTSTSPNMLSTHPLPPASYASSRSMSNLHRTNASPQRTRRKWDAPEYTSPPPNNGHVYQQPIQNPQVNILNNNPSSGLSTSISLQGLRSHTNYDSPLSGPKNSFAPVPQRIVPGTYTNPHQHQSNMKQQQQQPHHPGQMHPSMAYYEDNFDRANASRNSLTKKFMNLSSGPSSLAGTPNNDPPKTVWTPQKYENNRRPSNLFNNFSSTPNSSGIHRRQSEKITSVSAVTNMDVTPNNSRRLFQRNSSSNNISSPIDSSTSPPLDSNNPNSIQLRRKPMDRAARRRLTVSAYADIAAEGGVSTPLSPGFPLKVLEEEDYESSPLHMRSQSPSSLLLNLESEQNRSRPSLRKNSEMGSTMSRITPSSSRSNLRSIGSTTINKSSQALNKMLEAKEKLKKSQENLALQIGEDAADSSPTSSNSMARSRSIGNLRRTQDNLNNTFHGFEESGLSDNKRQMARSVTSLHNNGGEDDTFRHPDDYTLQAQYGSRRQSSSRLADSIRNLQKLSNPDLTNEHLFEPAGTSFGHNTSSGFTNDAGAGAPYYSTTLPKSMRKGAVSKRVYKATAARLDQTSESDSNTSDQTPNGNNPNGQPFSGSYIKSAGSGFLRGNNGPLRSSSSVEAGRVAANRRMFDSGFSQSQQQQQTQQRKPQNYLAQKINQYDGGFVGQDNGIIDESASPRSMASASFDVPMTDEHSKKMAMHLYECIEQFNTACDKILGARQLIDTDTSLTSNDREKLLKLVNKSISQGRGRLDNFEQGGATISSSSNRTTTLSGGTGSNASMGGPSHLASPSPTPSEPRISIDANFINRYGPQIMHLLQENMSKQN